MKQKKRPDKKGIRVAALFMALLMLLSGVDISALAEEKKAVVDPEKPTVTLDETEHGTISFMDEVREARAKNFKKGDAVLVKVEPDDGYEILSVTVKPENEKTDTQTKLTEEGVSFVMPDEHVDVTVQFASAMTAEESSEVEKKKVTSTEDYILANIDERYAKAEKLEVGDAVWLEQTMADGSKLPKNRRTFKAMYLEGKGKYMNAFMYDQMVYEAAYNTDDESDYYVVYADTMRDTKKTKVTDYAFAYNNDYGQVLDDCIYDKDTGLAYIPKKYQEENKNGAGIANVRIQLMQVFETDNTQIPIEVHTTEKRVDGEVADTGVAMVDAVSDTTSVQITKDKDALHSVKAEYLTVEVNGIPTENFVYDESTGILTIKQSAASIDVLGVNIKKPSVVENILSKITSLFSTEAKAAEVDTIAGMEETYGTSGKSWKFTPEPTVGQTVTLTPGKNIPAGGLTEKYYGSSWVGDPHFEKQHEEDEKLAANACTYIPKSDEGNNSKLNELAKMIKQRDNDTLTDSKFVKIDNFLNFFVHIGKATVTASDGTNSSKWEIPNSAMWLRCAHIETSAGQGSSVNEHDRSLILSVLRVNKAENWVLIGILTMEVNTQTGLGVFKIPYEEPYGNIKIKKVSANPTISKCGGSNYTLKDAEFRLWDEDGTTVVKSGIKTDDKGVATVNNLPVGTYQLEETKAPKGYEKLTKRITVKVNSNATREVEVKEEPKRDPMDMQVFKYDSENGINSQGNATLANAKFQFDFVPNSVTQTQANNRDYTPTISFKAKTILKNEKYRIIFTKNSGCIYEKTKPTATGDFEDLFINNTLYLPEGYLIVREITDNPSVGYQKNGRFTIGKNDNSRPDHIKPGTGRTDCIIGHIIPGNKDTFAATDLACVNSSVIRGGVKVTKMDDQNETTTPQGDAELQATFGIYNKSANKVAVKDENGDYRIIDKNALITTITTDLKTKTVSTPKDYLPYGHYLIKELSTHDSYINGGFSEEFDISTNGQIVKYDSKDNAPKNKVKRGGVSVQKFTKSFMESRPEGDATLKGAEFSITNQSKEPVYDYKTDQRYDKGDVVSVITTNEAGKAATGTEVLPIGTYEIRETKPSQGYLLNEDWVKRFSITEKEEMIEYKDLVFEAENKTDTKNGNPETSISGDVRVEKRDLELDESDAIGGGDHGNNEHGTNLNDIEFTIINKSLHDVKVEDEVYAPGRVVKKIYTHWDEELKAYTAETTGQTLPYGTYRIQETATNDQYLLTDGEPRTFHIRNDKETVTADKDGEEMIFRNQVVRGDIEFRKIADRNSRRMSTLWSLENSTTGEKHLIAADRNGEFFSSTENGIPHTKDTNKNDHLYDRIETEETIMMEDVDFYSGVWFGLSESGSIAEPDDSLGALPYGQYTLREIRTDSNMGYDLQKFAFYVYRPNKTVDVGTVTDDRSKETAVYTSATDPDGKKSIIAGKAVTIVDTVRMVNLEIGKKYHLRGWQMVKDENAQLLVNGERVEKGETFTATREDMTVEMEFTFDASELGGKELVSFEELYDMTDPEDPVKVAEHKDIEDYSQTVLILERLINVFTTASDLNGEKSIIAGKNALIMDVVTLEGLEIGTKYQLKGWQMLKDKNTELLIDGKPVESIHTFTAVREKMTFRMEFTFDASKLGGQELVTFEELYDMTNPEEPVLAGAHKDLEDGGQTVLISERLIHIYTTAAGPDGDKSIEVGKDAVIIDEVILEGLEVGKHYQLKGWQMTTGKKGEKIKLTIDGKPVESTRTFTAKQERMIVKVEFIFDASKLDHQDLVTFEELYDVTDPDKPVRMAEHKDIEDYGQTVTIPETKKPGDKLTDNPAKTGDMMNMGFWIAAGLAAAAALFIAAWRMRKSYKK